MYNEFLTKLFSIYEIDGILIIHKDDTITFNPSKMLEDGQRVSVLYDYETDEPLIYVDDKPQRIRYKYD